MALVAPNMLAAVISAWKADGTLIAEIAQPYVGFAPSTEVLPIGLLDVLSITPDEYPYDKIVERVSIRFRIVSDDLSMSDGNTAANALTALFDDAVMSPTGYHHVGTERQPTQVIREEDIMTWIVQYDFLFQES